LSTYIRIFCSLDDPVTRADIAAFLVEEKHFRAPVFDPSPDSKEADSPDWKEMRIVYDPAKRPLSIFRNSGDEMLREEKAEAKEEIQRIKDTESRRNLSKWLDLSKQVFAIEIDDVGATEPCWDAAESIERHLAQFLDGFIFVPAEAIYDPELERIVAL
jgi:hypothetical protein